MHFFGILGTLMFFIGGGFATYIIGEKLYFSWVLHSMPTRDITAQPRFYLALVTIVAGIQFFLAGSEMISRNSYDRNNYQVEKEV